MTKNTNIQSLATLQGMLKKLVVLGCAFSTGVAVWPQTTTSAFVTYRQTQNSSPVTKAQLEVMTNAPETLPSSQDPDGNWSEVVEGFQLSIRLEKKSFKPGERTKVTVLLRNATNQKIGYSAFFGSGVDLPVCDFLVTRAGQTNNLKKLTLLTALVTGGSRWFELHPQTQRKYEGSIGQDFDLAAPGNYEIYALGRIPSLDGKRDAKIRSATALFTIESSQNSGTNAPPPIPNR